MNNALYEELEIDSALPLKEILEALEDKQGECFQRAEAANTEERRQELELIISKIDDEIAEVKKKIKEEKISDKVEKLKQNDAEKKAKAPLTPKTVAPQPTPVNNQPQSQPVAQPTAGAQAQKAQPVQTQTQQSTVLNPVQLLSISSTNPKMQEALKDYYNSNFRDAFTKTKELAEQGDGSAMYVLSQLYYHGLGCSTDKERATFWLKRAADNNETAGVITYSQYCIINKNKVDEAYAKLAMLGDAGSIDAKRVFIETCVNRNTSVNNFKKAITYCDDLNQIDGNAFYDVSKKLLDKKIDKQKAKESRQKEEIKANKRAARRPKIKKLLLVLAVILVIAFFKREIIIDAIDELIDGNDSYEVSEVVSGNESEEQQYVTISVSKAIIYAEGINSLVTFTAEKGDVFEWTGSTYTDYDGTVLYEIYLTDDYDYTGSVYVKAEDIYVN